MKKIYEETKEWYQDNSEWFMDMGEVFKFENSDKSHYVYSKDNGHTIFIETYEKGGSFVGAGGNLPALSWVKRHIKEMENE
ncbi:hypothetical protein [Staphylococcus aureus]|uniref:Uncharacterized protein n=1 Tax=Staphylococcus aureus TaxID=1280 RepID=A0A517J0L8_STAAU|nr:hypothetical protein [Staphylococcus aureus]EZT31557.1 hypothetical protein V113_02502 [Staphylococcus aureus Tur-4]EZT49617.1 hypothetical protein V053_00001 [Staphylococcus aureus MSSA-37]EZT52791.1 hypothetical protein V056_00001 [Staphylococcus aureus MSSA-123]EZZ40718.1 hypothetical protein V115_00001 [Staphylococcus aureus Tur-12]KAE55128.1 hypothetical protein W619_02558 [Staphylococcus aureus VET0383R]